MMLLKDQTQLQKKKNYRHIVQTFFSTILTESSGVPPHIELPIDKILTIIFNITFAK